MSTRIDSREGWPFVMQPHPTAEMQAVEHMPQPGPSQGIETKTEPGETPALGQRETTPKAANGQKLMLTFMIPGEPKGKGRHRSRIAKAGDGRQFVTHYAPKETVEYENLVRMAASEAMNGRSPTDYPVKVTIRAYCSVPRSWSKKKQARALVGSIMPTGKPDIDNVQKAVMDGMNKIVFRDDSVACDVAVRKRYSDVPRVEVEVRELDGEPA